MRERAGGRGGRPLSPARGRCDLPAHRALSLQSAAALLERAHGACYTGGRKGGVSREGWAGAGLEEEEDVRTG